MALLLLAIWVLVTLSVLGWLFIVSDPQCPWDLEPVGDDLPLPVEDGSIPNWPAVAIVVPARNETEILPSTLPALFNQDYPGSFHVYIVDDRSSDGTAPLAHQIAREQNQAGRLTVINGAPLPEGWVGKVWAMNQGAQAALQRDVQFILLTDADIFHSPTSLRRLVTESWRNSLGLNSRMARLRCQTGAERLLIPAFLFFFNLLYPMRRVNAPTDKTAAAAGGCMLLSSAALTALGGGFEAIRSDLIDDVNLARQIKDRGFEIQLNISRSEVLSLREYDHLADIWKMVRRSAFTELQYSWLRLIGALAGLGLMFVVPVVAVVAGVAGAIADVELWICGWLIFKGMLALALMRHAYCPAIRFFELPSLYACTLPAAGFLYALMTLDSALRHVCRKNVGWREISTPKQNS